MVELRSGAPEFEEIPRGYRDDLEKDIRMEAFDLLHAEAVAQGDLPAPPRTWFNRFPGRALLLLFQVSLGGVLGVGAVIVIIQIMRTFRTVA